MKSRSGPLAGSLVLHAVLALILSMVRFAAPARPRPYESISLYPPRTERMRSAVPRSRPRPALRTFVPPTAGSIKLPNLETAPLPHNPVSPAASPAAPAIATMESPPPVIPSPPAAASPYTTALVIQPPRSGRQTATRMGMFSDAANRPVEDRAPAKTEVGSFDRTAGGATGGKPVPGRASASPTGFEAVVPERTLERTGKLRAAGFSDIAMAGPSGSQRAAAARVETQLEILSKPRPIYSEAARRLHVEGEVLLEAAFGASGQIQVLRVIRGLGHGLDENAIQAVGGIRFRPATVSGIPVDTVAMVRITFQLAN